LATLLLAFAFSYLWIYFPASSNPGISRSPVIGVPGILLLCFDYCDFSSSLLLPFRYASFTEFW
jgi:hypothetical protein